MEGKFLSLIWFRREEGRENPTGTVREGNLLTRNRLVLLSLLFVSLLVRAQPPKPLWEIDLSKFGYQGRPPAALQHLDNVSLMRFGSWIDQQGAAFTDPNVLIAYFVVHDDPPGTAAHREPLPSDPFRLVAIFLNSSNGELVRVLDWPLPANPNGNGVSASFFFPRPKDGSLLGWGIL